MFEPIAIIGRSCLLPGNSSSPDAFWQNVIKKNNCLSKLNEQNSRASQSLIQKKKNNGSLSSDMGGFVNGFDAIFDPANFYLDAGLIKQQDVLCQWMLHLSRAALFDAKYDFTALKKYSAGAIIGNLNYPTDQFNQYAEHQLLLEQKKEILGNKLYNKLLTQQPAACSRFMSGYPLFLLAKALGLSATVYSLDAACASSLYAIKYACDVLQEKKADLMFAGGINITDHLFLNNGFTSLQALSKTGQSRPLHAEADGLIPAHGGAIVLLKRWRNAIDDGDKILGIIRGIGLSNDGRSKGFLVPDNQGQIAAIKQAYEKANLTPDVVSWIECHATGTQLGDEIEIQSLLNYFPVDHAINIGALKSYIGHTITASGAAALVNVLSAFENKLKPAVTPAAYFPIQSLQNTQFKILDQVIEWEKNSDVPRTAAINCFGFGGNNAHLIVEEGHTPKKKFLSKHSVKKTHSPIAVVGMGVVAASTKNLKEFSDALFKGKNILSCYQQNKLGGVIPDIELDLEETRFSPHDLSCTLGQQLAIVKSTQEALQNIKNQSPEKASVFIASQCSTEIARIGLSARLEDYLPDKHPDWLDTAKNHIQPPIQAAHTIGAMPNIITNRLNQIFDFKAPSFSVFADEISAAVLFDLANAALQKKEIDLAVIGAVEMCCDAVHQHALAQLQPGSQQPPGDAAITLVLKRLEDAKQDHDTIYAILNKNNSNEQAELRLFANESEINQRMGYAFSASGMLHLAAGILSCHQKLKPHQLTNSILPWISAASLRQVEVKMCAQQVGTETLTVTEHLETIHRSQLANEKPAIWFYTEKDFSDFHKAFKLAIVANSEAEHQQLKLKATEFLKNPGSPLPPGIYYTEKKVQGEIAFVYTGATTSYAGMGQDLLLHYPELIDQLSENVKSLKEILQFYQELSHTQQPISLFNELKIYSYLSQVHSLFLQNILGISPAACIGYCSGESNALVAMGAWRDIDQFYDDIDQSRIYTETLAGNYSVLNGKYQNQWSSFRLLEDVNKVKENINNQNIVRLTIINSPTDCIIAGPPQECENFIHHLKPKHFKKIEASMLIHCDEFKAMSDSWYKIHYRKTHPVSRVRMYSSGSGKSYKVTAKTAANALLQQASATVDFPAVIRQAWHDGVRIFIEAGPRNLCSRWINDILKEQDHLAVSLDSIQHNSIYQSAAMVAQLILHNVPIKHCPFTINGNLHHE